MQGLVTLQKLPIMSIFYSLSPPGEFILHSIRIGLHALNAF
ncbi:unnamed protein product, partial [Staurois parvus]